MHESLHSPSPHPSPASGGGSRPSPLQRFASYAAAIACALLSVPAASAQTVEEFYRGKTLNLIVFTSPGGANDAMARLVAQHIGKHIPGRPIVAVQNMSGAGGLRAANYLYRVAAKDGTVLGTINRPTAFAPLEGVKEAEFDPLKYNWLGSAARDILIGVTWHTSPVKTLADALTTEVTVGADAPTADLGRLPLALNATVGTKFKVVFGYPGGTEVLLAMERGELGGRVGWSYDSVVAQRNEWLKEKKINFILQAGFRKDPRLPDVPSVIDHAKSDIDRQVMELMFLSYEMSRPYLLPPDVPADRVRAMQQAFMATMTDPAFVADAEKAQAPIDAITGDEIMALIKKGYGMPPAVIERARAIIAR
jgi:tripartite-type tricarboxylate transporter receptor subunit TctC